MLCIDGKPSTCLMHWHRHPGMEDARFFAECGIDLLSFIGHLPLRKEPDVAPDYSDGMGATFRELTHEAIDGLFHTLLQGNPRLLVLPRLRITVPKWWKEEHPETLIQSYSLTRRTIERGPLVSAHCKEWRSLVAHSLEETVRYLKTR